MQKTNIKALVQCALFAAVFAVCSRIQIDLPYVPINLGTLAMFLAGGLLLPQRAVWSVLLFLSLGFIGLPVFAKGASGLATLFGPTGGFLLGYGLGCYLISLMANYKNSWWSLIVGVIMAELACYICGVPWGAYVLTNLKQLNNPDIWNILVIPFIPGDIIKMTAAVVLIKKLRPLLAKFA